MTIIVEDKDLTMTRFKCIFDCIPYEFEERYNEKNRTSLYRSGMSLLR